MSSENKKVTWLNYPLANGFIHHWLVAGPRALTVSELERFDGNELKLQIAQHYYSSDSGIRKSPQELAKFQLEEHDEPLTWHAYPCLDDHFVNVSDFYHTCHHLQTWAYCAVESSSEQTERIKLTTNGPADVWVNDRHVHRQAHFAHQIPKTESFNTTLVSGKNHLLVRFEGVAIRECPYVMALQVDSNDTAADLSVQIPSTIEPVDLRQKLEATFAKAWFDRDVFVHDQMIEIYWPKDEPCTQNLGIRVQSPAGRIYSEQHTEGKTITDTRMGRAYQLTEGAYDVILMPHPETYYVHGMRVKRSIPIQAVRNQYSSERYGTTPERRIEALQNAAQRNEGLFSEIAKMALQSWSRINIGSIEETIAKINQRADCSDFDLVGLLGMVYRFWDNPDFPEELKQPLQECIRNFKYWMDEPGNDAMCYWSENHQILFHTCEILAGQLFPDELFSNAELTGKQHQEKGERMALSWLQKRSTGGFREWDSNTYFEEDVLALTHLVDLAESDEIAELAAVVLDKMFFSLALNSYKGIFGSTHGRTYTPYIKGAYLEPTSGLSRLLWGMGTFNQRILGTVSLACSDNYQLPFLIEQIAFNLPDALWNRERHAGTLEAWCDRDSGKWEVNKVTYKTPNYMLCSAQDYRPGRPGYQQHIWQATFSPDAVVFVTHPPCLSEDGSHRPNYWHGNVILPRVAQWKELLVAVHKLPEDDWLGFTHAYFPTYAFDEWEIRDSWAFARVDAGYLALTASQGIEQVTMGNNAYRDLRSYGANNVWLCHMGRAAVDGPFEEFKERILALDLTFDALSVHGDTLRGDSIDFGWQGPLLINEVEQPITRFKHYENPYCEMELGDESMDIQVGDQLMRLHFNL
ncbi:hypothetical protein KFU94_11035 [Chloroflexi bacterium TSY]|nr:hypothetical protein [Chloroflexi bacterium TSY]